MLNDNEKNPESRNYKPKIIRNKNKDNDFYLNNSSKQTRITNNFEETNKQKDIILSPKTNITNQDENIITNYNSVENRSTQNFIIDKDQLYETFLLFQNFMNSSQNISTRNKLNSPKNNQLENTFTINQIESNNPENKINDINKSENIISDINKENKIEEKKETENNTLLSENNYSIISKNINNNDKNNNNINNNNISNTINCNTNCNSDNISNNYNINEKNIINNFDDIPIKSTNINFEELLEKNLANEKYEESKNIQNKKIIKKHEKIKRKIISISKPSKNDKKYSYYTDLLDEDGNLDEKKYKNEMKKLSKNSSKSIKKEKNKQLKNSLNQSNMTIETESNNITPKKINKNINKNTNLYYKKNQEGNELYNNYSNNNEIPQIETLTVSETQTITKRNSIDFSLRNENKKVNENNLDKDINNKLILNLISNSNDLDIHNNENNNNTEPKINENNIDENKNINNEKSVNDEIIALKLNELEYEINKSREERLKIENLKIEYERLQLKLKYDINDFSKRKDEFERFREIELKKLEHEKNICNIIKEKNNILILHSKKDKEDITKLKKNIIKLQEENKIKDIEIKKLKEKLKTKLNEPLMKKNTTSSTFASGNLSHNFEDNDNSRININTKSMSKSVTSKGLSNPKSRKTISMDYDFNTSLKEIRKNNTSIKVLNRKDILKIENKKLQNNKMKNINQNQKFKTFIELIVFIEKFSID